MLSPGLNIILRSGFDPDATAYCNLTGAQNRKGISDFARGVKGMGLWSTSIFWLLRSSQSFGTGTVAPSFGGLATVNGDLINGPTWGANGIEFSGASNTRITAIGLNVDLTTSSILAVASGSPSQGTSNNLLNLQAPSRFAEGALFFQRHQSGGLGIRAVVTASSSTPGQAASFSMDSTSPDFRFITARADAGSTIGVSVGAETETTSALSSFTATADRMVIGTRNTEGGTNVAWWGTVALVGASSTTGLHTNAAAIYSLYKSTLGQGLGLP